MTNSLVKKMGEDEIKSLFGEHQNDETNIISTLLKMKDWVFLCGKCLTDVKSKYEDTYQYGGTWKSKKK